MAYTPPKGDNADFLFTGPYVPPHGRSAAFVFGSASTALTVAVPGVETSQFGTPIATKTSRELTLGGLSSLSMGEATTFNRTQIAGAEGTDLLVVGTAFFENQRRILSVPGWVEGDFGRPSLPNFTLAPVGIAPGAMGDATVTPRFVYAQGNAFTQFGLPGAQGHPRPLGFLSEQWGRPTAQDARRTLTMTGIPPGAVPEPWTNRAERKVYPSAPVEVGLFGDLTTRNVRRYLLPEAIADWQVMGPAQVYNRNRRSEVTGINAPSIPGGADVRNASPALYVLGIPPAGLGAADAGYRVRRVYPEPVDPTAPSGPEVVNLRPAIAPSGIAPAGAGGFPTVSEGVRVIRAASVDPEPIPGPWATFGKRFLGAAGGNDQTLYGSTRVELGNRVLAEVKLPAPDAPGEPTVWFRVRTISPASVELTRPFGTPRAFDSIQVVAPPALDSLAFGTTHAARNERIVAPEGLAGTVSQPGVQLRRTYVGARGTDTSVFSALAKAYNARQTVAPFLDPVSAGLQGTVGTPWNVELRSRRMTAYGTDMARMGNGGEVANKARVALPAGTDTTLWGTGSVAPRVRHVYAEGTDMFFSRYNTVANRSSRLEPGGIPRGFVGVPGVAPRPPQGVFTAGSINEFIQFGTAFAAARVRTLNPNPIGVPYMPDHEARQMKRFVAPVNNDLLRMGVPDAIMYRATIKPFGGLYTKMGEPLALNKTPEVRPFAWGESEFGKPTANLRVRHVTASGAESFEPGRQYVGLRTRYVGPNGPDVMRIPTHTVRFDAPELPAQQRIDVGDWSFTFLQTSIPQPVILRRSVLTQGLTPEGFGTPGVRSNVILVGRFELNLTQQCGIPRLNPTQTVVVAALQAKPLFGVARFSPHYIRMSEDADGYLTNPAALMDINTFVNDERFGKPDAALSRRYFQASGTDMQEPGEPTVSLRTRYIYPEGARGRMGFPTVPSGSRIKPYWGRYTELEIPELNFDTATYGKPGVEATPPYSPFVVPRGEGQTSFGLTSAELKNRTIYAVGERMDKVADPINVGPVPRIYPTATVMTLFGRPRSELKIRTLEPAGLDASRWGYMPGSQEYGLMKVFLRPYLSPAGIAPGRVGEPVVILPHPYAVAGMGDTSTFGTNRVGACTC